MTNSNPLVIDAFAARLSADFDETPFVVTPTIDGFAVGWDLEDARWVSLLKSNRVRTNVTYAVRVKGGRLRVAEHATKLSWHASGAPIKVRPIDDIRLVIGQLEGGTDAVFSTAAALDHIRAVGESLGLVSDKPSATRGSHATRRATAQSVPSPL